MKSFRSPELYFKVFGIFAWNIPYASLVMIVQNTVFVILTTYFLIGSVGILIFESNNFEQAVRNGFFCGSAILDLWAYILMLFNQKGIKNISHDTEELLDES